MEIASQEPIQKPIKESSPPTIMIGNREWKRNKSKNKEWSFYISEGLDYHISVEILTGQAHASPEGGEEEFMRHRIHVFPAGKVVNVPFQLKEAADDWLNLREADMRSTCVAFSQNWESAMQGMREAYAAAKNAYNASTFNVKDLTESEQREYFAKIRRIKSTLAKLEKTAPVVAPVEGVPGLWKVHVYDADYIVPASKFLPAKFKMNKDLVWAEETLLIAEGDFFLAKHPGGVLYICKRASLKSWMKAEKRDVQIIALPKWEYADGLLRSPQGELYRIPREKIPDLVVQSGKMRKFTNCVRVMIDGRIIAVNPKSKIGQIIDVGKENSRAVQELRIARREGAFIVVGDTENERMYILRTGKWPKMPEELNFSDGDWYKIMEPDGLHVFDVSNDDFFMLTTRTNRRKLWLDSLPSPTFKSLPHGTYTFTFAGVQYLVARGRYSDFVKAAMATKVRTGTPGCFLLKAPGHDRKAVDPTQIPADLLRTKDEWDRLIRKIPTATLDGKVLKLVVRDTVLIWTTEILPSVDSPLNAINIVKVTVDGETMIIKPDAADNDVTAETVDIRPNRQVWILNMPTGEYIAATGIGKVTLKGREYRYRMSEATWDQIYYSGPSIPTGSYNCFMLQEKGADDRTLGPISAKDPRLVDMATWQKWATNLPKAKTTLTGHPVYEIGEGPDKRYFTFDPRVYREPAVNTANCILLVVGKTPFPVDQDSPSLTWLDFTKKGDRDIAGEEVVTALERRRELPELAEESVSDESADEDQSDHLFEVAGYVLGNAGNRPYGDEPPWRDAFPQPVGRFLVLTVSVTGSDEPALYLFPAGGTDLEDRVSTGDPSYYMIHQEDGTWDLAVTTAQGTPVWLGGVKIDATGLLDLTSATERL
ncbi:hypothetical protein [Streptomyces sp. NBC_01614]|uniref:Uncharacterized protein n=1 Tax=Streptomyces sp. NBC_00180 TaxID=2903632 RepID=A0AAU1IBW3_9ACTN